MVRSRATNSVGGKDQEDIARLGASEDAGLDAHTGAAGGANNADEEKRAHMTSESSDGVQPMYLGLPNGSPSPAPGNYLMRARGNMTPAMNAPHSSHHTAAAAVHGGGTPPRFPPFRESYNDMGELRRELKVISVQMNLPYYMHHSSPQRLEARCPTWKNRKEVPTSCEFVVAANRHTNGRVYVTRAVVAHSPSCASVQNSGNYVSAAALMETAKPFMSKIADSVKPRDMANIMKEKFGVSTSYMTAWRALTAFKQEKKHEETASFTKMAGYLDAFAKSNEGSVVAFEHLTEQPSSSSSSHVFSRAFLCPKPLQSAVHLCRSQLLLSVFLVTSAYGGVVMTATAQDAMGDNIPIAVAIALCESEDNWKFFLEKLRDAVPNLDQSIRTLVSNRGPVLQHAAATVFPTCAHSDAIDTFLSPSSSSQASAESPSSSAAAAAGPSQNSLQWVEALCAKTPLMILVGWVSKVASTLFQRFESYGKLSSEYPEEFHTLLAQYEAQANEYDIVRVSEHGYEVIDRHTGRQRIVDFAKQSCTCGEYEASTFPCLHVFLAVSFAGMVRADVIPPIFLMKSLKALYVGRVTPIDVGTVVSDNVTVPNPLPKTRGRPRKIQQIQQISDAKHDKLACSICGVKGHNKRTCKRLMAGGGGGIGGGLVGLTGLGGTVDGEDPSFLPYGEAVFPGVMSADQQHTEEDEEEEEEEDGSPNAKRRKVAAAKLTEATIV